MKSSCRSRRVSTVVSVVFSAVIPASGLLAVLPQAATRARNAMPVRVLLMGVIWLGFKVMGEVMPGKDINFA